MPLELGQNQSVTQAVVTEQVELDRNTAPQLVALFKPDGTPFLGDTASVYSVYAVIWSPFAPELWAALMEAASPAPYPYRSVIFNQLDPEKNGIWQNMTGAPGTVGDQPPKKVADLPKGEAVIISKFFFESTDENDDDKDGQIDLVEMRPITGGFVLASILVDNNGVPEYQWTVIYRADQLPEYAMEALQTVSDLENNYNNLADRVSALENP